MERPDQDVKWLRELPPVPPGQFFPMLDEAMKGAVVITCAGAALEIGLFDLLMIPQTSEELGALTGIDRNRMLRFCDALCEAGLLGQEDGRFHLTPVSRTFLSKSSPYSQVHYLRKLHHHLNEYWLPLSRILRQGPVRYESGRFFAEYSLPGMAENALCGRLQATVAEILRTEGAGSAKRALDLGGGHGLYAIALAGAIPELEAWVFDLPDVIPLTQEYISRYGADRVKVIPGDFMTDEFGRGYDIILSSSNPSGKQPGMIPRIAAALNPGGIFANVQSSSEGEQDPYRELEWFLWTLDGEEKGSGRYTRERPFLTREYLDRLRENGLTLSSVTGIEDNYHTGHPLTMMIARKV
jgi:hypothetical protein